MAEVNETSISQFGFESIHPRIASELYHGRHRPINREWCSVSNNLVRVSGDADWSRFRQEAIDLAKSAHSVMKVMDRIDAENEVELNVSEVCVLCRGANPGNVSSWRSRFTQHVS